MIDFIGDIHGHRERLEILLGKLGYVQSNGSYRHPTNTAFFLGDYIDRGPDVRGTVNIVRRMVECGSAKALLGNHEFNALCFWQKNPNGGYLREHGIHKILIHAKTLESYRNDEDEFFATLKWFMTLPLFVETSTFRAQHACFDMENIRILREAGLETIGSAENLFRIFQSERLRKAVSETVQGPEIELDGGASYEDGEGVLRRRVRIKWWEDPRGKTLRDLAFQPGVKIPAQPLPESVLSRNFYGESEIPDFFGHYWLEGLPRLFRSNICCLDYSVASCRGTGILAAYRFDGSPELSPKNFFYA